MDLVLNISEFYVSSNISISGDCCLCRDGGGAAAAVVVAKLNAAPFADGSAEFDGNWPPSAEVIINLSDEPITISQTLPLVP